MSLQLFEKWGGFLGSVSNLLVERMPGFVFTLQSQEVNLTQFQEQVPHIELNSERMVTHSEFSHSVAISSGVSP